LLNRSIFKNLNLRIVNNSFIYNDSGVLSKEMDCMIVIGEGQKISFSKQYKYHIENIVGVIQVKKKVYKDSIDDAHQNLKSVIETAEPRNGEMYMRQIQSDAYKLLIGICGENSIIKNIGMPFGYPFQMNNSFYWEILQTSNNRPMYLLLELIWTRLSYRFELGSEIFGDDFALDSFHPFLNCRERKISEKRFGWEYNYHGLTKKELSAPLNPLDWEPIEINETESAILFSLIYTHRVKCNELIEFLKEKESNLDEFVSGLSKKRIAYMEGDEIVLLMDLPIITISRNGKTYIGENKSGQMSYWIKKQAKLEYKPEGK